MWLPASRTPLPQIAKRLAANNHTYSDGVLSDPSGAVVVKPCKQAEIDFYHSTSSHPLFQIYIPTFVGILSLNSDPDPEIATATTTATLTPTPADELLPSSPALTHAPLVAETWKPSSGAKIQTDLAIVLDNVAAAFKYPNILDVKLGARLWDDEAPEAKRAKLDKDAEVTTSKPLGLRIAGMRMWQGENPIGMEGVDGEGYRHLDKHYGRALTAETVGRGFEDFFMLERKARAKGPIRKVINRFLDDLEGLKLVLESEESRMYSSSLLFVYEGDPTALRAAFAAEREEEEIPQAGDGHDNDDDEDEATSLGPQVQALKLIDFAHAQWTPGQGPDENLLHGLRNTIKILEELVADSAHA
ncbi:MAG: hypothetical protein Q9190_002596 [Brigantiaea leucoxantha]